MKNLILYFSYGYKLSSAVINGPSADLKLKPKLLTVGQNQLIIENWVRWQVARTDLGIYNREKVTWTFPPEQSQGATLLNKMFVKASIG